MKKDIEKKLPKEVKDDLALSDEEFYKKYKFDKEEIELDQSVERGEWIPIPKKELEKEKKRYAAYAKYTRLKNKNINIRMTQADIDKLKSKAEKAHIPYQTIAASILHQYANDKIKITL